MKCFVIDLMNHDSLTFTYRSSRSSNVQSSVSIIFTCLKSGCDGFIRILNSCSTTADGTRSRSVSFAEAQLVPISANSVGAGNSRQLLGRSEIEISCAVMRSGTLIEEMLKPLGTIAKFTWTRYSTVAKDLLSEV